MSCSVRFAIVFQILLLAVRVGAEEQWPEYSPAVAQDVPNQLLWGDTHLHTNLSFDANGMGNKSLTPDDAYRFAKGQPIVGYRGFTAKLTRPLDFLVIADHAENLGVIRAIREGGAGLEHSALAEEWKLRFKATSYDTTEVLRGKDQDEFRDFLATLTDFSETGRGFFWDALRVRSSISDEAFQRSIWQTVVENAERHNEPGTFTAFAGYEWTSAGGGIGFGKPGARFPGNLHRVVVFQDGPEKTGGLIPFSSFDSADPEDLWTFLESYEAQTGGRVLAIPHNGNVSGGEMFTLTDFQGNRIDAKYAKTRSRWEPIYEVTQIKGDGEAHPLLSPNDEFADYETWSSWRGKIDLSKSGEGKYVLKRSEYARSALQMGLEQKALLGVNPFKFGLIGSTDAHTSLSTAEEANFWGKFSINEPSPFRTQCCGYDVMMESNDFAASGLAAVWARENTRESIFNAMKRREVYATTGSRMLVRFFGGWDFSEQDALSPDLAGIGYAKGVPMGGDLIGQPQSGAPSFLIKAAKDPDGANLDRVQVIKGWLTENGELRERIYNVALSGSREDLGLDTEPVGSTVDVRTATYSNSIGSPEMAVVWRDPNFDPQLLSFYYLRVLEIPTPRWSAYDARFFEISDADDSVLRSQQERAYSSPIWYTPAVTEVTISANN